MKALQPNKTIATIKRGAEHNAIIIGTQRIDGFLDQNRWQAWAVTIHENSTFMPGMEQHLQTFFQHLPDIIGLTWDEFPIRGEEFAKFSLGTGWAEQRITLP